MKYIGSAIVLAEIPECISLAISITNCPNKCIGCHSAYLRENIGTELNIHDLITLINKNKGINCFVFMGGDANPSEIFYWAKIIKRCFKDIKVAWYSGKDYIHDELNAWKYLDYIKIGSYQQHLGPLNSDTTNQRLYKRIGSTIHDITRLFRH